MTFGTVCWSRVSAGIRLAGVSEICALGIPVAIGIALCGLTCTYVFAGESPYQGSGVRHYYCSSEVGAAGSTVYFSAAFDAKPSTGSADSSSTQLADSFKQSLEIQYGYEGKAVCFGNYKTLAEVQTAEQKRIAAIKTTNKWTVSETGWTPDSSAAGPAVTQASPGSAAPGASMQAANAQTNAPATVAAPSAPALGTTLAVRMLEEVDSGKYFGGRQYRGMVTKAADAGNGVIIPSGSMAMVILTHGPTGWVAQLTSLTVKGQPMNASSGPATVMNSAQGTAATAVSTMTSALGGFGFGHKKPSQSAVQIIASGQRVFLPPGAQLQFALNSVSAGAGGGSSGMANTPGMPSPTSANSASVSNTIAGGSGGTLNAKISEVVLGPSPTKAGGKYVVSPDGGHYAAFAMHGSRELIVIDGVEGPEFDHAGHAYTFGAIDVVFTRDGKHSAYVGQSGDSLVAVVDGKPRATIQQLTKGAGTGELQGINPALNYPPVVSNQVPNQLHPILLSPSGVHYACIAFNPAKKLSNMVLDGVKGPDMLSINSDQIAFVNEQLVYAGVTPDQKWHVVTNNKVLGPEYTEVRYLRVTEDAKHYAFAANVKGDIMVVVDGKPGTPHHFVTWMQDLVLSSNGRTAFMAPVAVNAPVEHTGQVLFVDDREVANDIRPFTGIDRMGNPSSVYVVFSPDGAKYAYAKVVPGGVAAVIDGKAGRAYDGIGVIQYSQDSKHAYAVGQRGQSFVVVDGKEMGGVNRMENFIFSNDGMRFAYLAYMQDGNHVIIDGKESQRYHNFIGHSLAFSPDSKHYIYAACTNIMKCEVVRDGNATNVPALSEFSARTLKPVYMFPPVFFSPDSNEVAYSYSKSDGTSQSVYAINGKDVVHGTTFEFPSFSPDSKHFLVMGWNGHGYTLFADGKTGPGYQELLEANLNIARFENPSTYRFLGIRDGSVYRVTVDLASIN